MKKTTRTTATTPPAIQTTLGGMPITRATIEVSANHLIPGGYFYETRIEGILPRGRKAQLMTITVQPHSIRVHPLYGDAEGVTVGPEKFRIFVRSLRVVSNDLFPVTLTPEIEALARADAEYVCDCPAVQHPC